MELEKRFELINELRQQYEGQFDFPDSEFLASLHLNDVLRNCKDILCMAYRLQESPNHEASEEISSVLQEGIDLTSGMVNSGFHFSQKDDDNKNAVFMAARIILTIFWDHLNDSERLVVPLATVVVIKKSLKPTLVGISDGKEYADRNPISLHTILEVVHYLGFPENKRRIESLNESPLDMLSEHSSVLNMMSYFSYFMFNEHRDIEQSKKDQPRKAIDSGTDPLYALAAYFIVNDDNVGSPIVPLDTAFVEKAGITGCLEICRSMVSQSDIEPWINLGVSSKNAIAMYRRGEDPAVLDRIVPNDWISSWLNDPQ